MTGRLQGKSAFITGAGAGIAHVAALLFASEGTNVAVIEINEEKGAATAQAVRDAAATRCSYIPISRRKTA